MVAFVPGPRSESGSFHEPDNLRRRARGSDVPVEDVSVGFPLTGGSRFHTTMYFPALSVPPSGAVAVNAPTSNAQSPLS